MGGAMTLAAALAGALVMTGVVLLAAELTRRAPPPGTPTGLRLGLGRLTGPVRRRALLALLAGLAMLGLTRWPVAALALAAGVMFVPRLTAGRAARQHAAMLEGLEQWTRRLADMLTAGRGLEDALEVSARTAPAVIAGPVTALARRLSARVATEEALRSFAAEIGDPAGDRIAAALIIATGTRGGGVHGVLSALAEILARDVAARREIEADRAQHRTTIRWIVAFISGFTLFAIVNRSYSAPYGTLTGEAVLAFVAMLYAAGLAWLHRLGSIPAPGRFLGDQTTAGAWGSPAGYYSTGLGAMPGPVGGPPGSGVPAPGRPGAGSAGPAAADDSPSAPGWTAPDPLGSGWQRAGWSGPARQGAARPEPGRPEPGRPEPGRPEPGRPEPGRPEPGGQESGWEESGWERPGRQDSASQDSGSGDSGWQESGWERPGWQESGWQEPGWQEPGGSSGYGLPGDASFGGSPPGNGSFGNGSFGNGPSGNGSAANGASGGRTGGDR